jgi:hypothetical protein
VALLTSYLVYPSLAVHQVYLVWFLTDLHLVKVGDAGVDAFIIKGVEESNKIATQGDVP